MKKVTTVYFSPTGGSKKYVNLIAEKLDASFAQLDLTKPEVREKEYHFGPDDLVIFGAPVYAGRLPMIEGGIFDRIKGDHTLAVFTASYGNREFDDALLEMQDLCEGNGFKGIAAAGWIAPHTFSDKIAAGRPDEKDLKLVDEFAAQVKGLVEKEEDDKLEIPGNRPYKEAKPMPLAPEADANCTGCGLCAEVCPTGAIQMESITMADPAKCIACLACVKSCPQDARIVTSPALTAIREKLESMLVTVRKEPQMFFAEK